MILSAHISGTANSTVSLSDVVTNLNINESNKMNLSASVSTLCIAFFCWAICFGPSTDIDL